MPRKVPMRSCCGCGQKKEKKELIRIVRTPEGEIVPDETGKKSGRGVYLCRNVSCLDAARKKHSLSRSLSAEIPEEVYEDLRRKLLEQSPDTGQNGA